jgi:TRAP-type C4-dicarboxylate transport system permease small subunit
MKRSIEAIAEWWLAALRYTVGIVMIVMTGIYGINVLVREFAPSLAGSLLWIDTAARYMMIWIVFLGLAVALGSGRHIVVDSLWPHISDTVRRWLFALIDVTGFLFSLLMVVLSAQLAIFIAGTGQISPMLGVPTYIIYVAPIIGFGSLAFIFLLRLFGMCDARRAASKPEAGESLL